MRELVTTRYLDSEDLWFAVQREYGEKEAPQKYTEAMQNWDKITHRLENCIDSQIDWDMCMRITLEDVMS